MILDHIVLLVYMFLLPINKIPSLYGPIQQNLGDSPSQAEISGDGKKIMMSFYSNKNMETLKLS